MCSLLLAFGMPVSLADGLQSLQALVNNLQIYYISMFTKCQQIKHDSFTFCKATQIKTAFFVQFFGKRIYTIINNVNAYN